MTFIKKFAYIYYILINKKYMKKILIATCATLLPISSSQATPTLRLDLEQVEFLKRLPELFVDRAKTGHGPKDVVRISVPLLLFPHFQSLQAQEFYITNVEIGMLPEKLVSFRVPLDAKTLTSPKLPQKKTREESFLEPAFIIQTPIRKTSFPKDEEGVIVNLSAYQRTIGSEIHKPFILNNLGPCPAPDGSPFLNMNFSSANSGTNVTIDPQVSGQLCHVSYECNKVKAINNAFLTLEDNPNSVKEVILGEEDTYEDDQTDQKLKINGELLSELKKKSNIENNKNISIFDKELGDRVLALIENNNKEKIKITGWNSYFKECGLKKSVFTKLDEPDPVVPLVCATPYEDSIALLFFCRKTGVQDIDIAWVSPEGPQALTLRFNVQNSKKNSDPESQQPKNKTATNLLEQGGDGMDRGN